MRRILPAIGLYFLAPLVAEFLLGDIPIISTLAIPLLLGSSLLYGSGALLIREVVRRAGYGWPTIFTFALAYGVIEEGIADMSLFNPSFAGQYHLLNYGYIPALGIGLPWTLFVLGLHTIWSISVPIAVVETFTDSRRTTPWLGKAGLSVVGVLFVLGVCAGPISFIYNKSFVASVPQLVGSGLAAAVIVVPGILLGRRRSAQRVEARGNAPSPWLVGAASLAAGSLFMLIYAADPSGLSPWLAGLNLPPWLATILYIVLFAGMAMLVRSWSRLAGWSDSHRLALAGGALLTYAWHAFPWQPLVPTSGNVADLASNALLAVGVIVLLIIAARRLGRQAGIRLIPRSYAHNG